VVTDDTGRYLLPDLPAADYRVWVRGYGLADSARVAATPGQRLDLTARVAPDDAIAAQVYPAAYWYAMLDLPTAEELENIPGGRDNYVMWIKNMGCVGCHQLGQRSTRTLPPLFAGIESAEAWARRIASGQAGNNMTSIVASLGGVPLKYFANWTDRIATGELPAVKPTRPRGIERNVVATVRDWSESQTYLHDVSGTARRNPTVNGYGRLAWSSIDSMPILDPATNAAAASVPCATPTRRAPGKRHRAHAVLGDERIGQPRRHHNRCSIRTDASG
jgi:hypothetical protein